MAALCSFNVNCPIHRAKSVGKLMQENGVERVNWPAYSPDFKTVENVRAGMKKQMKSMVIEPETFVEVDGNFCGEIHYSVIVKLYYSMRLEV